MPIIVKDFTWRQTEEQLTIYVPLHGVPSSRVDIFSSDDYIKASFEAHFFECFPYDSVDTDESKATLLQDKIVFQLKKQVLSEWPQLEKTLTKDEKKVVKALAISKTQEKLTSELGKKREQNAQLKRDAVNLAIAQSTKQRNEIAAIKEAEKIKALGDIEELKIDDKSTKDKKTKIMKRYYKQVYQQQTQQNNTTKKEVPAVPLPRNCKGDSGIIEVEFTPRVLPTPSRESQEAEELEWLQKQQEARRTVGFLSDDLRPEERNPDYILYKAKGFMSDKNYLGAISAFSYGIELSPKLVDFYIGRSSAHFAAGNLHKCVRDCSDAIEMMKPEVYANLSQRVECIHRRGMALFKLGLKRQAEGELRAAINLQPSRELTRDLYEILDSPELVEKAEVVGIQEINH